MSDQHHENGCHFKTQTASLQWLSGSCTGEDRPGAHDGALSASHGADMRQVAQITIVRLRPTYRDDRQM